MVILTTIAVFFLVGGILFFLVSPKVRVEEEAIQKRLDSIASEGGKARRRVRLLEAGEETVWEKIASYFLGEKELPEQYRGMRVLLHQAGYPGERAVRIFWGVRIFSTFAFALGGFFFSTLSTAPIFNMLLLTLAGAALGYMLPYFHLRRKASERILQIQQSLPDTLDLLVVCVEAGLGMDGAMVRVGKEQADQGLAIGEEIQLMTQEVRAGVLRREAFGRMAERMGVEEIRGLVTFLNQTEEMGGSIARSLRIYANTMREKRSQKAEEEARKTVIKLIFPLVFLILPALFLIVLGPPVINIIKLFTKPY